MANDRCEYLWLVCEHCKQKNYRTPKLTRGIGASEKLKLMKYCPWERKHTLHTESRNK